MNGRIRHTENSRDILNANGTITSHEDDLGETLSQMQNPYYGDRYDANLDNSATLVVQQTKNIYYEESDENQTS